MGKNVILTVVYLLVLLCERRDILIRFNFNNRSTYQRHIIIKRIQISCFFQFSLEYHSGCVKNVNQLTMSRKDTRTCEVQAKVLPVTRMPGAEGD